MPRSKANLGVALINTAGNVGGVVSPILIGIVRDRTGSFQAPVLSLAALLMVGAVLTIALSGLLRRHRDLAIKAVS